MGATLTLEQVLDDAITTRLREAWTMLVGRVTGVSSSGVVTVQPLPNDIQSGEQVALPSLTLRVCFPAMTAGIVYPVDIGDIGLILFSCRPVGALLQSGPGAVELRDTRTHSLSDGFFLPVRALGSLPATLPVARDGDDCTCQGAELPPVPGSWYAFFSAVATATGLTSALPAPTVPIASVNASSNVEAT